MKKPKIAHKEQLLMFSADQCAPVSEWELCRQVASECKKCGLCVTRNTVVFGEGNTNAPAMMFIGEGPGPQDDESGRPFAGKAGAILDRALASIGVDRKQCYISHAVKCRPPDNRIPTLAEVRACLPYLVREIRTVRPKVIIVMGKTATDAVLLRKIKSVEALRNQWFMWDQTPVRITYHPAYIGKNPDKAREFRTDLDACRDKSKYGH